MPEMLELVWLESKCAARVRARPPWRQLVDEARRAAPPEDGEPAPLVPGLDLPPDDRRDVFVVLARAEPAGSDAVVTAINGAVREDGKFTPPLLLVAGELRFAFDEIEALKAAVTTATPFTGGDEPLAEAVAGATGLLTAPGLLAAPAVTEALVGRIRDAFGRVRRAVPPGYFDAQVERALLEHRRYQKRVFAGKPRLRALLEGPGDRTPMLVYLPADVAPRLPLFQRFPARLVAAAHLSTDQFESHPFALEALALARQIPAAAPQR